MMQYEDEPKLPTIRKTVEIDTPLEREIQKMADERIWSFSQMAYVLLQQAVKERNRKKKSATKENNT